MDTNDTNEKPTGAEADEATETSEFDEDLAITEGVVAERGKTEESEENKEEEDDEAKKAKDKAEKKEGEAKKAAKKEAEEGKNKAKDKEDKTKGEGKKAAKKGAEKAEEEKPEEEKEEEEKPDEEKIKEDDQGEGLEEGKPVPYARFAKLIEQKNTAKQEAEEAKETAEFGDTITEMMNEQKLELDFNEESDKKFLAGMLGLASQIKNDPAQALLSLNGLTEEISKYTGDTLPEDLQKRVDDGELSEEEAKELSKTRAENTSLEGKNKNLEEENRKKEAQLREREIGAEVNSFLRIKEETDAEFPKDKETKEKLLTQLAIEVSYLKNTKTSATGSPTEIKEILEEAYDKVIGFFGEGRNAKEVASTAHVKPDGSEMGKTEEKPVAEMTDLEITEKILRESREGKG